MVMKMLLSNVEYGVVAMIEDSLLRISRTENRRVLTPEEDAIGEPEEADDDVDDMLPADLWF
jgi:hypothetical protein